MSSIGSGGMCCVVCIDSLLFLMGLGMIMLVKSRLMGVLLFMSLSVVWLLVVVSMW